MTWFSPPDRAHSSRVVRGAFGLAIAASSFAFVASATAPSAKAADLGQFQPGRIISDAVFFDSGSMTTTQIDAFLDLKGASCHAGEMPCLKDYTQTTWTIPADAKCAGTYVGASNESAGTIIGKVAQACGINPQVLLVTLQKEQGLVTMSAPTATRYNRAMGFACPDTGHGCDPAYNGFFTQVYKAAWQLQNYTQNPTRYNYRAGRVNTIQYNPNLACGTTSVYIENQATANLYIYTPYAPNAAALAAGYGTGNSCSAYGNRNFYNYFNDWFGPSWDRAPIGNIDAVGVTSTSISVSGWALDFDTTGSIPVHVYVDGVAAAAVTADGDRPDVGAYYGRGSAHGFSTTVSAAPGTHQVCLWGINNWSSGTNTSLGCRSVSVVNHAPTGSIERMELTATGLEVAGWAYDPDLAEAASVTVSVDGVAHTASASTVRTDVPGRTGPSGFDTTVAAGTGSHQACVSVSDNAGGVVSLGCRTLTVAPVVAPIAGSGIVPIIPTRVADMWVARVGLGQRCISLTAAGVPSTATGAYVNLTAVRAGSAGNIVVYPYGGSVPGASSVHLEEGADVATGSWVGLGTGAQMCWSGQGNGAVELLVDVSAYTTSASTLVTQTPQRLVDTRANVGTSHLPSRTVVSVPAAGHGGIPTGARAAMVSVTVVGPPRAGNLRMFASGSGAVPGVATVNYSVGQTKSNSAIVPIGADGAIALYSDTFTGSVDVIVDVTGYLTGGVGYSPTVPTRLLDTRSSSQLGTLNAGQRADLDVRRTGVVPQGATAVVVNVTAVQPSGAGNLRVFSDPGGVAAIPNASTINYIPGRDVGNLVVVAIGADGMVGFYNDQVAGGRVDATVDIVGYLGG